MKPAPAWLKNNIPNMIFLLFLAVLLTNAIWLKAQTIYTILFYLFLSFVVTGIILVIINAILEKINSKFKIFNSKWSMPATMILVFLYFTYRVYLAPTQIGHPFERYSYEAKYYVNVWENRESVKNYRLEADIVSKARGPFYRDYYVKKIYWPNGGYLWFVNELFERYANGEEIELGEKNSVSDQNNRTWYVELTTMPVEK